MIGACNVHKFYMTIFLSKILACVLNKNQFLELIDCINRLRHSLSVDYRCYSYYSIVLNTVLVLKYSWHGNAVLGTLVQLLVHLKTQSTGFQIPPWCNPLIPIWHDMPLSSNPHSLRSAMHHNILILWTKGSLSILLLGAIYVELSTEWMEKYKLDPASFKIAIEVSFVCCGVWTLMYDLSEIYVNTLATDYIYNGALHHLFCKWIKLSIPAD